MPFAREGSDKTRGTGRQRDRECTFRMRMARRGSEDGRDGGACPERPTSGAGAWIGFGGVGKKRGVHTHTAQDG